MTVASIERLFKTEKIEPIQFGLRPTPLEYHAGLSKHFGVEIFVKREDLIDNLANGNKLRKLSYVVAEALNKKATVLVTAGSLASNQCKAVAYAAACQQLRAHLIYTGDHQRRPSIASGNYLITSLFEPTISWFEETSWAQVDTAIESIFEVEKSKNEIPFSIPPGAPTYPGILGSIELGFEIANQLKDFTGRRCHVIAPAGSGGTCRGVKIAADQSDVTWNVYGICIGENSSRLREKQEQLTEQFLRHLNFRENPENRLFFEDSAISGGYDNPSVEELETIQFVAGKFGILLDPNYMVKAFHGMCHLIRDGRIKKGERVILIHTGGHFGLFCDNEKFVEWHSEKFKDWTARR